ncbi:MAG TPA: hypothetical protein VME92_12125 [Acetobacteraceae bacterium]|nr:hypothetical protein [Acetobacteraceae bacterium]
MEFTLVVVRPFGSFQRGDVITDADAIKTVLQGEQAAHVVRVLRSSATKEG